MFAFYDYLLFEQFNHVKLIVISRNYSFRKNQFPFSPNQLIVIDFSSKCILQYICLKKKILGRSFDFSLGEKVFEKNIFQFQWVIGLITEEQSIRQQTFATSV